MWSQKQAQAVWTSMVALVEENAKDSRSNLVQQMCSYNTLQHFCNFCDYLNRSSSIEGITPFAQSTLDFKNTLCSLYFKSKPMLSGGIGGDREVREDISFSFLVLLSFHSFHEFI